MEFLTALWLPILLSAVFVASSVLHMVLPVHRSDAKPLPEEDEFCANLKAKNVEPGEYCFPACASMKDMGNEEMMAKCNRGLVGFLLLSPDGPPPKGKGADNAHAFRVSGSIAVSIYTTAPLRSAFLAGFGLVGNILVGIAGGILGSWVFGLRGIGSDESLNP